MGTPKPPRCRRALRRAAALLGGGLLAALLAWPAAAQPARDDARAARMQERIDSLTALLAEKTDPAEKEQLARRLESMKQELAIVEQRQAIDSREHALQAQLQLQPREQLRAVLQTVPSDTKDVTARLSDLATLRAQATAELADLRHQLEELPRPPAEPAARPPAGAPAAVVDAARAAAAAVRAATARRAALEEGISVKEEQLRSIALQQEAAEVKSDLIARAQTLREKLRAADVAVHLSLRGLYEQGLLLQGDSASTRQLDGRRANVEDNLRNAEAAVELARQKQENYDEELTLLENRAAAAAAPAQPTAAPPAAAPSAAAEAAAAPAPPAAAPASPTVVPPPRRAWLERFIASENARRARLGQRLEFLGAQVKALRETRTDLETQSRLTAAGHRFLQEQFRTLWLAYLQRLGVPLAVAVLLLLVYLAISRLVLPRRYRREELFLARRLGRYSTALVAIVVAAVFLIEDITTLATTLGLVSAALVISLQDVCASFFAWFVIMLGRKFTIGDRLEIDGVKGDVLDIQLLRTTLVEVNAWLGADQPTGRIIVIPNNLVFKTKVFNYSHGHPFIWSKIELTMTFATPASAALALFRKVLAEETREEFAEARRAAAALERRYGVADAEYEPRVHTRIADSGITFSLFYVTHYRQASAVGNRINRRLIAELEQRRELQLAYNTLSVLTAPAPAGPTAVLGAEPEEPPPASG